MEKQVLLPELAESVVEGEILKWMVDEGANIEKDQPLVEVMTDKVTVELPSPYAGVLTKKLVEEGDVVPVEAVIALIAEAGSAPGPVPAAPHAQAAKERSIVEPGPPGQDTDDGARLSLFKPDDVQEVVKSPFAKEIASKTPAAVQERPVAGVNAYGRVLAVPAARKLAHELAVDISRVPGSGPGGRVRKDDVRAFAAQPVSEAPAPAAAPPVTAPSGFPPPVRYKTPEGLAQLEERVPLRGIRRAISSQMFASHLYSVRTLNVDEADFTPLVELRGRLKPRAEAAGVKLSYLPFIFKAVVAALKKFPSVNSSLDEDRGEIVYKHYYNLGMAVATEAGLLVPVVKEVDRKSVLELAGEIVTLADKARNGKLDSSDISGSTFSITNIGSIGALFSFPIINVPDAAILGVHSIQERPVARDGEVVVRKMMYLSLSFDHRLVDGAEAARFSKELIRLLENPDLLMLEAI